MEKLHTDTLRVGAGTAALTADGDCFPTAEDFGSLHDSHVRAIYMDGGEKLLIVTVELTSIPPQVMSEFQAAACRCAGLSEPQVWICATHTFGSPHLMDDAAPRLANEAQRCRNQKLRQAFTAAITMAVDTAVKTCRPAKVGYGEGKCAVNVSRDVETRDGWWLGHNEDEVSDKTVAVLKYVDMDDRPIAILFNYGVQSSVTQFAADEAGLHSMTGDLAGAACLYLEREFEVPAVFCVGACGDQAPMFNAQSARLTKDGALCACSLGFQEAFFVMRLLGERLGEAAAKAAVAIACESPVNGLRLGRRTAECPAQRIRPIPELHATRAYDYGEGGTVQLTVAGAKLGNVTLIAALPEMTSRMVLRLKAESPAQHTVLLNMVSNISPSEGKYLADDEAYKNNKYEAMNSKYARGAADIFHETALALITELHAGQT